MPLGHSTDRILRGVPMLPGVSAWTVNNSSISVAKPMKPPTRHRALYFDPVVPFLKCIEVNQAALTPSHRNYPGQEIASNFPPVSNSWTWSLHSIMVKHHELNFLMAILALFQICNIYPRHCFTKYRFTSSTLAHSTSSSLLKTLSSIQSHHSYIYYSLHQQLTVPFGNILKDAIKCHL